MDVKDLNKSQLILLVLLLSFITSIATGIMTVSLMQQAPIAITTPINRVVQQTVEKIQQVAGNTTTQTIVVKEEDLVVDAIAKNKPSVFTVTKSLMDSNLGKEVEMPAGDGFVVSSDGVLVTDAVVVADAGNYFVTNDSGKFKATFLYTDKDGFSFLKIGDPVDPTSKLAITVPSFGDLSKIKVGQKIILLGDTLSSFIFDGATDMKANITKADAGEMVLDLDGDALGIALSSDTTSFASINDINTSLAANVPSSKP